jgi:hypothetical protein
MPWKVDIITDNHKKMYYPVDKKGRKKPFCPRDNVNYATYSGKPFGYLTKKP